MPRWVHLRSVAPPFLLLSIQLLLVAGTTGVHAAQSVPQSVPTITSVAGGGPHDVPALSVPIFPEDLVVDAAGNIWFPERFRHRIYKVDTGGILRLVAGTGIELALGDGGPMERASFLLPDEIALTPAGDLLVYGGGEAYGCCNPDFDEWNRLDLRLRKLNLATGTAENVTEYFRSRGFWPDDMTVSPDGRIFVASHYLFDALGPTIGQVYSIDPATGVPVHIAGNAEFIGGPLDDGMPATDVSLLRVESVAAASIDELLLADGEHLRVRTVDLASGIIDSYAPTAGLYGRLAFDGGGNLYATAYSIVRRVDGSTGAVSVVAGTGVAGFDGDGGPATHAQIRATWIAFDAGGNLYLAGEGDGRIRRVDQASGIIETVAGNPLMNPYGDGGPATQALVRHPVDVAPAPSGDLYIAEAGYTALRKVDGTTGEITTLFRGAYGDTGFSNLSPPTLSAVAYHAGTLYYAKKSTITDIGPLTEDAVFRYDFATGESHRIAGSLGPDCTGEGGLAVFAALNHPRDIAFDAAGNLFIADAQNHQIRRVAAATGIITRVAGITGPYWCATNGGYNGDGLPAMQTQFNYPSGIALDASENLYIADLGNHRIRRVDAVSGIVTTVAGTGQQGFSGDGGPAVLAQIRYPERVELDAAGNLFIAANERIRRVDAVSGNISTLAGDGILGFHGDGGPAALAGLGGPHGMAFDAAGDLLVAAREAGRIRKIVLPTPPTATATATPVVLWPPSHHMVVVHVDVDTGASQGPVVIELHSITSNEPDDAPGGADGSTEDDVQLADIGTADFDFELRAERSGGGAGRVYTIVYIVTTEEGLSTTATAFVTVPHDRGGVIDPVTLSIQETPSGTVLSWDAIPGANSYSIARGEIGALADAPDFTDMGSVVCIESRSKDLSTAGDEDTEIPGPGRAWFYVGEYRDPHPSTYGSADAPKPRVPLSGACN